jgi:hypothetical protein
MYLKMKDVPLARREEISHFGFHDVGQAVKNGSIGKFMLFTSTFYFAVFLASPFYAVLMLTELGFSYVAFMVVICSDQLTRLVVLHFWGKYADRNGSLRVIKYVSAVLPLTPLMWLVSQNVVYLVLVQITAGIAWAGFELCAPNFIYGGAPQGSRIKYIALFRALNGVGAAGGALVGGYLATILPPLFGQQILSLFLLSGIIRGIVVLRFLPSIIDITLKGRNKPAWGSLRPKGLMAADAVTDGFGWGLLYIPENMRRDLRKAFQPAFPQDKTDAPKQGSLLQRWARFALRQKNDTEPVLVYVDTHEDLRRQVLRRRAINEQTAAQARAAKKNDENTVGLGTRLVKVLKSRFGVDAPAGKAKEDTKVSLLHNNQLGKKMMEAVQERQNMQAQTASRAARNETHHKLAQHAIRQLAEKNNTAANSAGVKQQSRTGLLRNGLDTAAHKKSEAGVEVERSGKLIAGNKRDGLLYREGAWQSYQKNASSSGNVTAMGMVSKPLVRHGLFNNAEAWASYVQKDQKSSVKSGPMDKLASMKRPGELVAKTGPMNRLRANL